MAFPLCARSNANTDPNYVEQQDRSIHYGSLIDQNAYNPTESIQSVRRSVTPYFKKLIKQKLPKCDAILTTYIEKQPFISEIFERITLFHIEIKSILDNFLSILIGGELLDQRLYADPTLADLISRKNTALDFVMDIIMNDNNNSLQGGAKKKTCKK
jgi:hypothetical protein